MKAEKNYINPNQIQHVFVYDEGFAPYLWKPEKRFMGIVVRKAGFRYIIGGGVSHPSSSRYNIRGTKIYEKPHVEVVFIGGDKLIYRYNTIDLAKEFAERNFANITQLIEIK